ncbi:MAG: alpha/beta hydrolase [Pirellula sp.]
MQFWFGLIFLVTFASFVQAQSLLKDVPYLPDGHPRHVLDIYKNTSTKNSANLPVVFWIHGGGWQTGDKSDVAIKPKYFTEKGYLFVACNYRLLPDVSMEVLIEDVASAIHWVHREIASHGGNPESIIVGGHSAGAQLAALLCIDDRYLKANSTPVSILKGCIPVDGDTYDIPKIILTAEHRQAVYGGKMPTFGHRQKFGNDPEKHVDFSAVTHVSKNKKIPPFLILYVSGNPDTTAQAKRLEGVLKDADIPVVVLGKHDSNHSKLNDDIGVPDDPATKSVSEFLERIR